MGITRRDHHARHARFDQTISARRRVIASLRTRLQRHIGRRTARIAKRQRLLFRVRAPAIARAGFRNHGAITHDHAADGRVVARQSHTRRGEV